MMGDPNKKMDRLSAKHKSLYDRFEMGQTSEKEEQRMFRLEDRMDKVGKKIKSKKSPLNQGVKKSGGSKTKYTKEIEKNNRADSDDVIKFKKQLIEQSKQKMLQTGRGKTTKSPFNQGKKEVKTLGKMEDDQNKEKWEKGGNIGFRFPQTKTKLQTDAKRRNQDPDFKKPKAKTLKK